MQISANIYKRSNETIECLNADIFSDGFSQILMNVRRTSASAVQEPATTRWETTPASVHPSTCRWTEETTAWVRAARRAISTESQLLELIRVSVSQIWERACATATSTTPARTSSPSTWPRRCAAAPITWAKPGTDPARPVPRRPPVSVGEPCLNT